MGERIHLKVTFVILQDSYIKSHAALVHEGKKSTVTFLTAVVL